MVRFARVLALAGGLLLAGMALPALADTPAGTLVMAKDIDDILTLDPAEVYEFTGGEIVANTYDRLVRFEAEDLRKLVPAVAESWTVSEDGRTFTFKLRPGLKFHSGNPLTAEDVAFSLQRVVRLNKTPAFLITQLGWTPANVGDLVTAVDPGTVRLTIKEEFAPSLVLNLLSSMVGSVVDRKTVLAHEKDGDLGYAWLKTNSAGSGPFQLRGWKPNESVILDANPDYRLGPPRLKRVVIRHVPEPGAQRLLLEKGDVDIARNLTADQVKGIAGNPSVTVEAFPTAETYYLALNQKDERLAKPGVRQAMRWLIDYQGMVDTFLKGQFQVHQTFWPSGFDGAVDDTPFHIDVAKAKALLAEAGYPNGFEVRLDTFAEPPVSDMAQSIQQTMAQAGIKVSILPAEQKQIFTKYRARQHQMVLLYWSPD